jgi:hypothetical protein
MRRAPRLEYALAFFELRPRLEDTDRGEGMVATSSTAYEMKPGAVPRAADNRRPTRLSSSSDQSTAS